MPDRTGRYACSWNHIRQNSLPGFPCHGHRGRACDQVHAEKTLHERQLPRLIPYSPSSNRFLSSLRRLFWPLQDVQVCTILLVSSFRLPWSGPKVRLHKRLSASAEISLKPEKSVLYHLRRTTGIRLLNQAERDPPFSLYSRGNGCGGSPHEPNK